MNSQQAFDRFRGLLGIAERLPAKERKALLGNAALAAAREIEDLEAKSRALLLLHLELDEPLKTRALRESLEAALRIGGGPNQQAILSLIAKQLSRIKEKDSRKARLDDLMVVVRAGDLSPETSFQRRFLRDTARKRGRILGEMAPKLEDNEVPLYFDLATQLPDNAGRAFALSGLAPRLSEEVREDAFRIALKATRGVSLPQSRSSLIRRMGAELPEGMLSQAVDITMGLPPSMRDKPLSVLAPRLEMGRIEEVVKSVPPSARRPESSKSSLPLTVRSSPVDPVREALSNWLTTADPGVAVPEPVDNLVNTGFSRPESPRDPLPSDRPLAGGGLYCFWLEVGKAVPGAVDKEPSPLPVDLLPRSAELQVVLFTNEEDFELHSQSGALRLRPNGLGADVVKPASLPPGVSAEDPLLRQRLFFSLRTPEAAGRYHLRCNIYYRQVLVQGRRVNVTVGGAGAAVPEALLTTLDYTLSRSLAAPHLQQIQEHKLSVMMNADGDASHGFYFHGEKDFNSSARFDGLQVQNLIDRTRKTLRAVSWGEEGEWKADVNQYRYSERPTFDELRPDLVRLARAGYLNYDAIINQLSGGPEGAERLAELMRRPGHLQLALRESARLLVPIALLYDHPLDTQLPADKIRLCPQFKRSSSADSALEEEVCFLGDCPHREDVDVVCPSGFWGFRHSLGIPLTIGADRDSPPDVPGELSYDGSPDVILAVCTDEQMRERLAHVEHLKALIPPERLHYADTREDALKRMKETRSHIVYFYCHGGRADGVPFLQVGPLSDPGIESSTLRWSKIRWSDPRPLVFINGCHTTDLEPENAIDLLSGFVETAGASAVVGTEITIFEPLAVAFGEHFLRNFLAGGSSLGEAIRSARLLLLKSLNPLGLVYLPFGLASLRLTKVQAAAGPLARSA